MMVDDLSILFDRVSVNIYLPSVPWAHSPGVPPYGLLLDINSAGNLFTVVCVSGVSLREMSLVPYFAGLSCINLVSK